MALLKELSRLRRNDHNAARLRMAIEDHELCMRDMLRQRNLTSVPCRNPAPLPLE